MILNSISDQTMKSSVLTGHTHWVTSVAFSPDGSRIVSGSDDKTIRLWDATTGEQIGDPLVGHTDWVRSVAFSPDGSRIVSGSDDKTIRLWNATTGHSTFWKFIKF
jgi:WD40 repeat protein